MAFRKIFKEGELEIVANNDLTNPKMLAHLLKYDSVQGAFGGHSIENKDSSIIVDGNEIPVYSESDASKLPWEKLGVDIVLECTGFYTSKAKSQAHIDAVQ